jgi:uncharacterized cupredoxin-like copper-binding protein
MRLRLGPQTRAGAGLILVLLSLSACSTASAATEVRIDMRYSAFSPAEVRVPRGVPVTIVLRNEDPIDHEWVVGTDAVHQGHRSGTEPHHTSRPTEVSVPALGTVTTVVTFPTAGTLTFICHLPGHEAYGMVGSLVVE